MAIVKFSIIVIVTMLFLCSKGQAQSSYCYCDRDCSPGWHLVRRDVEVAPGYHTCTCDCVMNDNQSPTPPKHKPAPAPAPPKHKPAPAPAPPKQTPTPTPPKQKQPSPTPSNSDICLKMEPPSTPGVPPKMLEEEFLYNEQCYSALKLLSPCITSIYGIYGPSKLYHSCCNAFQVAQQCGVLNFDHILPPEAIISCNNGFNTP